MTDRAATFVVLTLFAPGVPAHAQVGRSQGVLNADLARDAELGTLPELHSALVGRILAARRFANMAAFHAVVGGGRNADRLTALCRRVFLPINLNTATREEIVLVPGAGRRMLREFKGTGPIGPSSSSGGRSGST